MNKIHGMNKIKLCKGLTLVELLIVLVIMGILSAVSLQFYGNYVVAANRTDARTGLTATATALEKCKALYGAYNNAACNAIIPATSAAGFYTITGTSTVVTYELTATPVTGEPQANDAECTSLTLSNTGIQSGTGTTVSKCW
ncbi:MAG: type IV pilus assembly protein PilE [Candidatus Azotimanducaceae bacterium]|jgi:type IV pilus assembly protein PilE